MKKAIIILFMLFIASSVFAQTKLYDIVFVKANDIAAYNQYLEEQFSKIHQKRIDEGMLLQWDVWKVVDNPQEDFTHMITYIFDIDKYGDSINPQSYLGMTDRQWQIMQQDVSGIRTRVGQVKWNDLGSARKKGVDYLPEIMVLNFMMLKNDQWETYEQAEINATKSIANTSVRVGWNFHRRIDDYGTDNYFSHVTVDWFDQYKDYLKLGMGPLTDASKANQDWNELRELKKRVVMQKLISLGN